jgi:DNA-binding CsgD family transcriptional regulator
VLGLVGLPIAAREREIVDLISRGLSNKEVGRQLNLQVGTIKVHLHNMYTKLEVPTLDSAFSAQLGTLITYHAVTRIYGYLAYVEIRGQRGGLRRLDLGLDVTMVQAQQACKRHYEDGCDLSKAKKIIR